jgi:hypothetical protein
MNYPIWDIPLIGGGLLIGFVAIIHVFVSHFAVGGGLYLALTERKAIKENNKALIDYLKKHSRFFLLLTVVLGAVSGRWNLVHDRARSPERHIYFDSQLCLWLGD